MRLLLIISLTFTILADATEPTPMEVTIQVAIDHDRRTGADRARDRNRQSMGMLTFLGLKDDMQVLELMPGGSGS